MTLKEHTKPILLASTFTVMAGSAVAPALPGLLGELGRASHAELKTQLVIGLSAGCTVLASPLLGRFTDQYGNIRVLFTSLFLIALSGGLSLIAQSLNQLLLSRILLGVGVAGTFVTTTSWLGHSYAGEQQKKIMGWHGFLMEASGLIYFLVGGLLATLHWRASFAIYLLALPLLWRLPRRETHRSPNPLSSHLPFHPLRFLAATAAFLAMFGLNIYVINLPFILADSGARPWVAGVILGVAALTAAFAGLVFSSWAQVKSFQHILRRAFLLYGLGFAGLAVFSSANPSSITLFNEPLERIIWLGLATAVCGFSFGLTLPTAISWINTTAAPEQRGRAQSRLTTAAFAGQFLSPLLFPLLLRLVTPQTALALTALMMSATSLLFYGPKYNRSPLSLHEQNQQRENTR